MNTPLSWIKAYVPDLDVTPREFVDRITLSGSHVESHNVYNKNLEKIVVGKILKIERHPDADKLVVCQVDVGQDAPIQIVTGAPNVKEGDIVPTVLDGGKVAGGHDGGELPPDGIKIKKGKLRGVESFGMMCASEELGATRDLYPEAPEDGVYVFPEDAGVKPGDDAVAALGLDDTNVEYEITSNRVDCFSIIGMAREAAVTFDLPFYPPEVKVEAKCPEKTEDYISVEIKDPDLCKRYIARVVKNVKIAPSPKWLQHRLRAQGIRAINNVVDITNYVMEEYGQPMHAYDYDLITGHEIIVKRAQDGDTFQTLDGQVRNMDANVLMINDGEKAVGIAGIMGGENSKITDDVKTMVFEAACFDGANIRLSAKRIGLRSDASGKFEKGLDPNTAMEAMNRACQLIEELGCGEVVGGAIDVYPNPKTPLELPFEPEYINDLIGTDLSEEQMLSYFPALEIGYRPEDRMLIIPTWRQDLLRKCDIAEEVARFYGYDNIPTTLPSGAATAGKLSFKMRIESTARDVAEFCGFSQAYCYSFESPKVFDKLLVPEGDALRNAITIMNPLGEDFSIMRTTSLNGMLTSLATNYKRRNKDVKLYEIANVYLPKALPLTELPDERVQFTLGMYSDAPENFFYMKGVVEEFLDKIGLQSKITYAPDSEKSFLHPGRQANIIYEGEVIGFLGEVHPAVADNYEIGSRVTVAVLDMPGIVAKASYDRKYEGIAKYPAMTRDISMLMKKDILCGQIEEIIEKKGGKLVESYHLFDIYEGSQIADGFKSMAYSITFRAPDRTLEDKEVNGAMDKILTALEELGINLRK